MIGKRLNVVYEGVVQGVGFRWTCTNLARGHAIVGCVRNLPDGSVELIAEGEEQALLDFHRRIEAHFASNIRESRVQMALGTGEFSSFDIVH